MKVSIIGNNNPKQDLLEIGCYYKYENDNRFVYLCVPCVDDKDKCILYNIVSGGFYYHRYMDKTEKEKCFTKLDVQEIQLILGVK